MHKKTLNYLSRAFLLLLLIASPVNAQVRFPAEFEPQSAIWMAWPEFSGYTRSTRVRPVFFEMLKALQPRVHVKLLVPPDTAVDQILRQSGVPVTNISYHVIPYSDIWTRDMGPVFVVNGTQKRVVDFGFNGWGMPESFTPEELATDEQVDRAVAEAQGLGITTASVTGGTLVSEGGNREFNGKGTLIAIAKTELQRNPRLTLAQIEAAFKKYLGVKKVIWLEEGIVEDSPPTVGRLPGPRGSFAYPVGVRHVDEVVRFSNANTLLLAEVSAAEAKTSPLAAENRKRLERAYALLSNATDQDGKPFTIVRVPAAKIQYAVTSPGDIMFDWLAEMTFDDGLPFPTHSANLLVANGYLNFVVTNGLVLVPAYGSPLDGTVMQILKMAFPGRTLVGINPFALNVGGGGMHCITQQEPKI